MRLDIDSAVSSLPVVENSVAEVSSDINRVLKQGVAAAQSGDRPMARTLLLNVTEADPKNVDAWLWLASTSEYPEELLVFLNNVLAIDPENSRALTWKSATCSLLAKTHVQRGQTAMQENQKDYAMQCFDKAIETDENCEMAWFWKASLLEDEAEKLTCLERALSLNPANEDTVAAVKNIESERSAAKMHDIKVLASTGDHAQANDILISVLEVEPMNTEAWVLRSHLARSFEDKIDAYENILKIDPSNAFARFGFDFLSELVVSAKPAEPVETESEGATENFAETVNEVSEAEPEWPKDDETVDNFGEPENSVPNDDEVEAAVSAAPEVFEETYPMGVENTEKETISFYGLSESTVDDSQPASAPMAEAQDEFVSEASDLLDLSSSGISETESVSDEVPAANFSPSALSNSPSEVNFFSDQDLMDASRETAERIDPFREVVNGMETPSIDTYDFARESDVYASPFAETQTFKSDSFDYNDSASTDELVTLQETAPTPFQEEGAYSETEPSPLMQQEVRSEQEVVLGHASELAFVESTKPVRLACDFCGAGIDPQSFSCDTCRAVLTLSDLESLLANDSVNRELVQSAVTHMETEWNSRTFTEEELKVLGVGHFNLKNFDMGLAYLQEASRNNPNDVILSSQLNTLAIRLGEIRKQKQDLNSLPKGKTILVVDDSATVRKLISSKLEKCGHNVLCAADGVEAMEIIADVTPDLVLLDIAMPRMDGYQVCKQIRSLDRAKDVPVVMVSGKDGFFDKVRGRMAGSTDHISKPFGPETLMKTLETYLAKDLETGE